MTEAQKMESLFVQWVVPLLAELGLEPMRWPEKAGVGEFLRSMGRALTPTRTLFFVLWRKPHRSFQVGFFLVEGPRQDALPFNYQLGRYLDASELTLELRFECLQGALVQHLPQLTQAVPELAPESALVSASPKWVTPARVEHLWSQRYVRAIEDSVVEGQVVFATGHTLMVDALGERHTLKFDTTQLGHVKTVTLSRWWVTPAGTRRPLKLEANGRAWEWDTAGALK